MEVYRYITTNSLTHLAAIAAYNSGVEHRNNPNAMPEHVSLVNIAYPTSTPDFRSSHYEDRKVTSLTTTPDQAVSSMHLPPPPLNENV